MVGYFKQGRSLHVVAVDRFKEKFVLGGIYEGVFGGFWGCLLGSRNVVLTL